MPFPLDVALTVNVAEAARATFEVMVNSKSTEEPEVNVYSEVLV